MPSYEEADGDEMTVLDAMRRCDCASCRDASGAPCNGTTPRGHRPCCLQELLDRAAEEHVSGR